MQFAKDSFFVALQERLAGLNPSRMITVSGTTVPAVLVVENLPPMYAEREPNTFYIEWGTAEAGLEGGWDCGMMSIEVAISYYTSGSVTSMVDRGRLLGQLDSELLHICQPPNTEKRDYTQSPSADLGTRVFWSAPRFPVVDATQGGSAARDGAADVMGRPQEGRVGRRALLRVYFFPEVATS